MTRSITLLGIIQTVLVVAGIFSVRMALWASGYPDDPTLRWNPLAVFIYQHGYWLIALPIVWGAYAVYAETKQTGEASKLVLKLMGGLLIALLLGAILYCATKPYTRPVLLAP